MLFVVLLVVPQEKASLFHRQPDRSRVPNPSMRSVYLASGALIAAAFIIPSLLDGTARSTPSGYGLALGIVALSLVPLTGYAGQISLAPLAFAGIGAVVMYQWGSDGNPLALVLVVVCAVVGALVALPALRLKGLYLALSTMAFALFCEKAVFPNVDEFSQGDAAYERLHLGPIDTSERPGQPRAAGRGVRPARHRWSPSCDGAHSGAGSRP